MTTNPKLLPTVLAALASALVLLAILLYFLTTARQKDVLDACVDAGISFAILGAGIWLFSFLARLTI